MASLFPVWTVLNVSGAPIPVLDVPDAQSVPNGATAQFQAGDFLNGVSATLAAAVATGALCIISYGSFVPASGIWAPVTYQAAAPGTAITQSGQSLPFSLGPFSRGLVLLNVTALGSGATLAIGFQAFDGTNPPAGVYYPAQSVIPAVSATGPVAQAFAPTGIAGRLTWTLTGPSATFGLVWQVG